MSWLFSRALVEEFSEASFLDGEPSVPLNGNPTQQAYLPQDKMTKFSRLSQFGMTFKPLTESLGAELLTLYLAGFHAKTLAQQEKVQGLTENEAECGEKWRGSFVKYDPNSYLWKTHQCSLLGDLESFSETWPSWGLMLNGECWERPTLEQIIKGTEFGLSPVQWATPTTMDKLPPKSETALMKEATTARPGRSKPANLRDQVSNMHKWPTPTASQARSEGMILQMRKMVESGTTTIEEAEAMIGGSLTPKRMDKWSTPQSRDWKDTGTTQGNRKSPNLGTQAGGKLNPTWVEWLMGWPLGWTDLKPLETDKFHFVQQQHGES